VKKWTPLLVILVVALAAWVLWDRLKAIDFADVVAQLRALPLSTLLVGVACSVGVYTMVSVYEGIGLRIVSGQKKRRFAARTALIANPIGRAIGFAVVSGGALRYRMYTTIGLNARQTAAIALLVAMPYVLAVGWLIDFSLLFSAEEASRALRVSTTTVMVLGVLGLMKDVGWLVFVSRRKEPIMLRGQPTRLPTLQQTLVQIGIGLVEIMFMTAILYVFMPPELGVSLPAFVGIYSIAFAAGQLSSVPAGLGVLEAALLLMLPHVPPAKLLSAVVAYRGVYEVLPLLVGLVSLAIFEITHPHGVVRRRPTT
jgi:glycosyltransferase 2 family protein